MLLRAGQTISVSFIIMLPGFYPGWGKDSELEIGN